MLVSVGRTPNGKKIGAEAAGVAFDERGYIRTDKQMRTNVPHIFAIGDIAGRRCWRTRRRTRATSPRRSPPATRRAFDARQIPSVAYTDPEIAWAGATEDELKKAGTGYGKSPSSPGQRCGRAIANGRDEGFVKLLFDKANGRVIGGGIVGPNAGDLISEICLAIEMGADAEDIGAHHPPAPDARREHRAGGGGPRPGPARTFPRRGGADRTRLRGRLAELADAVDSKSTGAKPVPVRFRGRPLTRRG